MRGRRFVGAVAAAFALTSIVGALALLVAPRAASPAAPVVAAAFAAALAWTARVCPDSPASTLPPRARAARRPGRA